MADAPEFPTGADASVVADWAELFVCVTGEGVTRGRLVQAVAREGAGTDESVAQDAWAILGQRNHFYGSAWPLQLSDDDLTRRGDWNSDMAFHAFLCVLSIGDEIDYLQRRLFEHCVTDLVRALTDGPSQRLGAPRVAPIPASLSDAVEGYGALARVPTVDVTELGPHDQDVGLDVVSWILFEDGRGSYLHFVGQCATGRNWPTKTMDLSVDVWRDYVQWAPDPVRFFAIPAVIHDPWRMRRITQQAGLVLDRPRLMQLAASASLSDESVESVAALFD